MFGQTTGHHSPAKLTITGMNCHKINSHRYVTSYLREHCTWPSNDCGIHLRLTAYHLKRHNKNIKGTLTNQYIGPAALLSPGEERLPVCGRHSTFRAGAPGSSPFACPFVSMWLLGRPPNVWTSVTAHNKHTCSAYCTGKLRIKRGSYWEGLWKFPILQGASCSGQMKSSYLY